MSLEIVTRLGIQALTTSGNIFDRFQELLENYTYGDQIASLADIKTLSTTVRGQIFEIFCQLYLLRIWRCNLVWLGKEIPPEVREYLGLPPNDFGIDIVAVRGNEVYAVQCKWKRRQAGEYIPGTRLRSNVVNWKELGTFYSLCARTGIPVGLGNRLWTKHIVMTSCPRVRRVGGRQPTDQSICCGSFQAMTSTDWYILLSLPAPIIREVNKPRTVEELREARLLALQK